MSHDRVGLEQARQLLVQARPALFGTIRRWAAQPQSETLMAEMVGMFDEYFTHELVYQQKLADLVDDLERRLVKAGL